MKKTLIAVLSLLCAATLAVGLTSCFTTGPDNGGGTSSTVEVTYTLSATEIDTVVVKGATFNETLLKLTSNTGITVDVTKTMVSGWDTATAGEKTLTVKYGGETIGTVKYTVKNRVQFEVDGATVGEEQLVINETEVVTPANPAKEGFLFTGWKKTDTADGFKYVAQFKSETETNHTLSILSEDGKDAKAYAFAFNSDGALALNASFGSLAAKDYEIELSNDNVECVEMENLILITTKKAGVTELTVTAKDPVSGEVVEATKTLVVKPRSLLINEVKLGSSDIEGVFTLGGTLANGNAATYNFDVALGGAEDIGDGLTENIVWKSSSSFVTVDNEGVVTLAKSGDTELVSLTAALVVDGVEYQVSAPYTFRCVYNAVNVDNYTDLYNATKASKEIVLNANIAFPTAVADIKYETVHTTYDDTYYKNIDKLNEATIKVLLQFRNNLYGNGYVINAHNATMGLLDGRCFPTESTLFRGPLNFVAMADSGSAISVKAQDNVCFGLYEGVTANNVELRGCDLLADNQGNYDLTDLTYIGTTVEVFGDDVTIEYSRITNGRTTVRIFGDETNAEKEIHVDIKNSVLSGAREFILRMGSNCFVDGYAPYIGEDNETKREVDTKKKYATLDDTQKAAYDDKYIKTFVNVKNSVFKDAGIFAVGIDAHFSGSALHEGHPVLNESDKYWRNLAKTSYGAKLTFEGEVMMYTWKPLNQVDSSTLIEIPENSSFKEMLDFNVAKMVGAIGKTAGYESMLDYAKGDTDKANPYVHAGIAFFGGGKNYGVFENKADNALNAFEVGLGQEGVDMGFLQTAAGTENFYFLLSTSDSLFSYAKQQEILAGSNAYACLKK